MSGLDAHYEHATSRHQPDDGDDELSTPVNLALRRLTVELDALERLNEQLASRLKPVLAPPLPVTTSEASKLVNKVDSVSQLVASLDLQTSRVVRVVTDLSVGLERLEV